jgi:class 3 adenylate cyclase/tetratricopeptide (TPR) repeat protein
MTPCPNCGQPTPDDARFCANCGHALVTRVGAEERRHVTALFADLVASTSLSDQLDPEVVRGVVSQFFERSIAEIRRFGGSAEQFRGDAIMALFGLQQAHEDDPERAVRAAFAVRDGLAALAPEAAQRHGIALQLRIGIEAGEVVVGDPFGGSTMATGDVLNLAARLEEHAAPGEIVVGPAVHAATERDIAYEPAGTWEIRGKAAPVSTWRAVAHTAVPGGLRGLPGRSAPLTGREEELTILRDTARRASNDRKALLFTILGQPGVGKSRLARELGIELEPAGWRVLYGRCLPYGEGITYWPLGEVIRDLAEITPEMNSAVAQQRLAAVSPDRDTAERLAFAIGLRAEAPVSGESLDREIAYAVRRLVESPATDRPILLVVEDIHWAEPPLLDLLEYLATWTRDRCLLIVALARPDLIDRRPGWGSGRMEASRLQLEALSREEATSLVHALLAADGLPEDLRDRILDRAEGNPLFVEETIRMLIDQGAVVERDGAWVAANELVEVEVPETIEALVRARIDALPRDDRSILQCAAVIGRTFRRSALAALVDGPVDTFLDEAILRDLVSEEPAADPSYRFKHLVIRDVAYGSLPKARRAALHRRTVEWLIEWAADRRDEFVEIEAQHLEQAVKLLNELEGQADGALVDQAVAALRRSTEKAGARDDLRAVISFANRALALHPRSTEERLELQTMLLEAMFESGDFAHGRDLGAAVAEQAGAIGRRDLRGRALLRAGLDTAVGPGRGGQDRQAGVAILLDAREELRAAGDQAHEADVMYYLGFGGLLDGNLPAALSAWQDAAALAHQAGDAGREVRAQQRVIHTLFDAGRRDEAEQLLRQAVERAPELSIATRAQVWKSQGQYLTRYGIDVEEGRALLQRALEVGEQFGDFDLRAGSLAGLAEIDVITGAAADALRWSQAHLDLVTALGHDWMLAAAEHWMAQSLLAAGDASAAEAHARRATTLATGDDPSVAANAQLDLARVYDALGRAGDASEVFDGATETFASLPFKVDVASFDLARGAFHIANGRADEGEAHVARARTAYEAFLGPQTPFLAYADRIVASAQERAAH